MLTHRFSVAPMMDWTNAQKMRAPVSPTAGLLSEAEDPREMQM
jgi:hypothetical protein